MQNKNQIAEEIAFVNTLKMISQAYQEISLMKMQQIRDKVLSIRQFLTSLYSVFYDVKHSYEKYIEYASRERIFLTIEPFSILPRNGKRLTVLLSGNEKMNGDILSKVFKEFYRYINTEEGKSSDLLIIGKIGKEMLAQRGGEKRDYEYVEVPDNKTDISDLKEIIQKFIKYQEINVFYGRFKNIVTQEAIVSNITGDKPFEKALMLSEKANQQIDEQRKSKQANQNDNGKITEKTDSITEMQVDRRFLYEPSIEELVLYFESQVFTALFDLTISEARLARYASRINAMEEALANIKTKRLELHTMERKVKKSIKNKNQNSVIAGIFLWDK